MVHSWSVYKPFLAFVLLGFVALLGNSQTVLFSFYFHS